MPADRDDDAETGDDAVLGAAWGGSDQSDGGPLPDAEEARARAREQRDDPDDDEDAALVDRITVALVKYRTAFTIAVLVYGLLVMPWLYQNGYEGLGLAGGVAFLGGIVLLTVANAQAARETVSQSDERRGF
jgi:hypothetical protein